MKKQRKEKKINFKQQTKTKDRAILTSSQKPVINAMLARLKLMVNIITSSKEMAGVLNEYFASVFMPQNQGPVPASRHC